MTRPVRVAIAWLMALVVPLTTYASAALPCAQHGLASTAHRAVASTPVLDTAMAPADARAPARHAHGDGPGGVVRHVHALDDADRADRVERASSSHPDPVELGELTLPCSACMVAGCKVPTVLCSADVPVPLAAADPPTVSPAVLRLAYVANVLERPPSLPAPRIA